jgi:hypothetical protein
LAAAAAAAAAACAAHVHCVPPAAGAVARLLLDQLVYAPIFISTFIALLMKLDGASNEAIK